MLETIAIVLVIMWILGFVTSYTMGGFIHIPLSDSCRGHFASCDSRPTLISTKDTAAQQWFLTGGHSHCQRVTKLK